MDILHKIIEENIECPLRWLDKALSKYFKSDKEKAEYASKLWQQDNYNFESTLSPVEDTRCNNGYPKYVQYLAGHLYRATLALFQGSQDDAKYELDLVQDAQSAQPENDKRLEKVSKYLVDSLRWCLEHLSESQDKSSYEDTQKLKATWQNLQSCKTNQAVIIYMENSVKKRVLKRVGDKVLLSNLWDWDSILALDPDYYAWYHYAYQNMRRQRHSELAKTKKVLAPSKKEIDLCEKALSLAPNNLMSMFDYAMLLKDCFWLRVYESFMPVGCVDKFPFEDFEHTFNRCTKLFDEALVIANERHLDQWICKIQQEKAETLFFVGNSREIQEAGLTLLHQCREKYADDAYVYQKLGHIYGLDTTVNGKNEFQDKKAAKMYYEQAVKLGQSNYFECLKYYFKISSRIATMIDNDTEDAVNVLSFALTIAEKRMQNYPDIYFITIWRGCFLWKLEAVTNKFKAQKDWITAWNRFPERPDDILKDILFSLPKSNKFNNPKDICTNELKKHFQRSLDESLDSNETEGLRGLIKEIVKYEQVNLANQRSKGVNSKDVPNKQQSHPTENRNWFYDSRRTNVKEKQRNQTPADLDNDWRSNK